MARVTTTRCGRKGPAVSMTAVLAVVAFLVALGAFVYSLLSREGAPDPSPDVEEARHVVAKPTAKAPGNKPVAATNAVPEKGKRIVDLSEEEIFLREKAESPQPVQGKATPQIPVQPAEPKRDPERPFDNRVENLLAVVSKPGTEFIMAPVRCNLPDDEIMAYLRRPVEIYDDDDEATIAIKERTAAAKTDAIAFIENGGTFNQFIRDMVSATTEQAATVEDVRCEMIRILKNDGPEAAQDYLDKANPYLEEQGLSAVGIPESLIQQVEKERQEASK